MFSAENLISNVEKTPDSSFLSLDEHTPFLVCNEKEEFLYSLERDSTTNNSSDEALFEYDDDLTSETDTMILCMDDFKTDKAHAASNGETSPVSDHNDDGSSEEHREKKIVEGLITGKLLVSLLITMNGLSDFKVQKVNGRNKTHFSLLPNFFPDFVIKGKTLPSRLQEEEEISNSSRPNGDEVVTNQNDSNERLSWKNTRQMTVPVDNNPLNNEFLLRRVKVDNYI